MGKQNFIGDGWQPALTGKKAWNLSQQWETPAQDSETQNSRSNPGPPLPAGFQTGEMFGSGGFLAGHYGLLLAEHSQRPDLAAKLDRSRGSVGNSRLCSPRSHGNINWDRLSHVCPARNCHRGWFLGNQCPGILKIRKG